MTREAALQPTLWRTCRVLANRTRLRVFGCLVQRSPRTVSSVASRLGLSIPVASQSLRALEARGLLSARRAGRYVEYRLNAATTGIVPVLVPALRSAFRQTTSPVDSVFKLTTAFTHPRRIEIFRTLKRQARTLGEMRTEFRISMPALCRHLAKLKRRGFIVQGCGRYLATNPCDQLGRALARLTDQ